MAELKIKSDNPWDTLRTVEGKEFAKGEMVFSGPRKLLVNGQIAEVCEPVYGGEYMMEDGRVIEIVDGIITDIKEGPPSLKEEAKKRVLAYKRKI